MARYDPVGLVGRARITWYIPGSRILDSKERMQVCFMVDS